MRSKVFLLLIVVIAAFFGLQAYQKSLLEGGAGVDALQEQRAAEEFRPEAGASGGAQGGAAQVAVSTVPLREPWDDPSAQDGAAVVRGLMASWPVRAGARVEACLAGGLDDVLVARGFPQTAFEAAQTAFAAKTLCTGSTAVCAAFVAKHGKGEGEVKAVLSCDEFGHLVAAKRGETIDSEVCRMAFMEYWTRFEALSAQDQERACDSYKNLINKHDLAFCDAYPSLISGSRSRKVARNQCREILGWLANPKICSTLREREDKVLCRRSVRAVDAARRKDPSRCGADPWCLALADDPNMCSAGNLAALERKAMEKYCREEFSDLDAVLAEFTEKAIKAVQAIDKLRDAMLEERKRAEMSGNPMAEGTARARALDAAKEKVHLLMQFPQGLPSEEDAPAPTPPAPDGKG